MKLAIIASRSLRPIDAATLRQYVNGLVDTVEIVTGGRPGGEMVVARAAIERGLNVHMVISADRSQLDPEWKTFCTSSEELPDGTLPSDHAIHILDQVEGLVLIMRRPSAHPASWHAPTSPVHRQANRRGMPYALMVLEPEDGAAPYAVSQGATAMLTLPCSRKQTVVHQPTERVAVVMTTGDTNGYALLVDGAFQGGQIATRATWRAVKSELIVQANTVAARLTAQHSRSGDR